MTEPLALIDELEAARARIAELEAWANRLQGELHDIHAHIQESVDADRAALNCLEEVFEEQKTMDAKLCNNLKPAAQP